ncbi:MAG: DUF4331 domain-containing protein [Hyphomicrobiales bacterium]
MFRTMQHRLAVGALLIAPLWGALPALASSHMDAPLISLDDPANTTDVYAFKSRAGGIDYLTTALGVYPFEEPGIGPNNYRFDPQVDYEIHVALGGHATSGKADLTYRFEFNTAFVNPDTVLQSYLGVVAPGAQFSPKQNLRQRYKVTKIDHRNGDATTVLGTGLMVPPNNQGRVTPFYNQGNNGNNPAREGVANTANLDDYTRNAIESLLGNYLAFAGQRDDGFYADIQSIFDLDFSFDKPAPFDSQGGYNIHMIALNIPLAQLGGAKIAGVYATTSRHREDGSKRQVARQGNPLFVEALIALKDKNRYNRSSPRGDERFTAYADDPEISRLLGVTPLVPGLLKSIFIPDLIRVDLTTAPARLAGQAGFHRLSVFGGDVLHSTRTGGDVAGGWPNGRRFGDDVVDIAIIALGAAGPGPDFSGVNADKVMANDITYNRVFPYAATPLNGRSHEHNN